MIFFHICVYLVLKICPLHRPFSRTVISQETSCITVNIVCPSDELAVRNKNCYWVGLRILDCRCTCKNSSIVFSYEQILLQ